MSITVATNKIDVHLSLISQQSVRSAIAWQTSAATTSTISESEASPIHMPAIGVKLDGKKRKAYIEFIAIEHQEVTFLTAMISDVDVEYPDTYYLYLDRAASGTWRIHKTIIVVERDDEESDFRGMTIFQQLDWFFRA